MNKILDKFRGTVPFLLFGAVLTGGTASLTWKLTPKKVLKDKEDKTVIVRKESQVDTTLMGYDVTLPLETFKNLYADRILQCEKELYPPDHEVEAWGDRGSPRVHITVCNFKDRNSSARFFDDKLFSLSIDANEKNIRLIAAVEAMKEKTDYEPSITYLKSWWGIAYYPSKCAANFKFLTGKATVFSEGDAIGATYAAGGDSAVLDLCAGWGLDNLKWGGTMFTNDKVREEMNEKLKNLKASVIKDEAKKLKF